MKLKSLLRPEIERGTISLDTLAGDIAINDMKLDSREITAGDVFVALPSSSGGNHGLTHAAQARAQGACAILSDSPIDNIVKTGPLDAGTNVAAPVIIIPDLAICLGKIAARFFVDEVANQVAMTGTNGKSSTVALLRQLWEIEGIEGASLGTVGIETNYGNQAAELTTPNAVELHRSLAKLARQGVTHAAIEASSHGLHQFRLNGLKLKAAGFSNLSQDHLDYHTDFEDYFAAKALLFRDLLPTKSSAVISVNSEHGRRMLAIAKDAGHPTITTGTIASARDADMHLLRSRPTKTGQQLTADIFGERLVSKFGVIGVEQTENALMAIGLAVALMPEAERAKAARRLFGHLEQLRATSGRMQIMGKTSRGAIVVVDYAHTPDSLMRALRALAQHTTGRVLVVFGAGGNRDKLKRPMMGKLAAEHAFRMIVTDDNPRSEDPAQIRADIIAGIPQYLVEQKVTDIGSRADAIEHAMSLLENGDILLVAGKGHETGQHIGDETIPFSDQEVISALLVLGH